jgi:hypothetical protein
MRFYAPWFGFDPDGARRYPDGTVIVWSGSPGGSSSTPKRPACPKIRLHDVRHSYATAALAAGIPAKVVSERLGHANIAITMDTYSHVLPGLDAQAAGTVARPLTKRPAGRRRRREVKANLLVSGGVIEGTRTPGLRDHNLICWFGIARAA